MTPYRRGGTTPPQPKGYKDNRKSVICNTPDDVLYSAFSLPVLPGRHSCAALEETGEVGLVREMEAFGYFGDGQSEVIEKNLNLGKKLVFDELLGRLAVQAQGCGHMQIPRGYAEPGSIE